MLTEKRQQLIFKKVQQNNVVTISELSELFAASDSTIRRDLQILEDQNLLTRVHGGAKKNVQLKFEATLQEKQKNFHFEKRQIAKLAASFIQPNDVIYLDAGSTTMAMISFIPNDQSIKVVTNSVHHAALLVEHQIDTIIIGGQIKLSTSAILGAHAYQQLQQFCFNKAFMGMNGIDSILGFTTPDIEEANIKKLAINQSQKAYILADHSKFHEVAFANVADLDSCTIICDTYPLDFQPTTQTKIINLEEST